MKILTASLMISFISFALISCQQEATQQSDNPLMQGEGIEVTDAWARPGAEGRMSAAYFRISNFNTSPDKLMSVQADVAGAAEVHESYQREEGMMGMREVSELEVPAQSTIRFEQGGLHVMLMDLNRQLSDGDSFQLTLRFENVDSVVVDVPVRL